jgi:hypothetical protein
MFTNYDGEYDEAVMDDDFFALGHRREYNEIAYGSRSRGSFDYDYDDEENVAFDRYDWGDDN